MRTSTAGMCIAAVLLVGACGKGRENARRTVKIPTAVQIVIDARTEKLPTFPCSECHKDRPADPRERRLTKFHSRIEVAHGSGVLWCYRCHTADAIDQLHLPDGTRLSFDQVPELCGGCHGNVLRDFGFGVHGLTTGQWNGTQHRAPCTFCHDPHHPAFPEMTPLPPPPRGRGGKREATLR
jgi:hypothetical protein